MSTSDNLKPPATVATDQASHTVYRITYAIRAFRRAIKLASTVLVVFLRAQLHPVSISIMVDNLVTIARAGIAPVGYAQ